MTRSADLILALVLLLVLSPLLALVAVCVRFDLGSPVLFRQRRPGLRGEPFVLLKFRTMRASETAEENTREDEQRLTRFGRFLRSSSLDELPELWNVVRGEMSLVGPRPLLMKYIPLYTPEQMRRHDVKPGITGWTQINGRNALTWDEKFKLDIWYVDNRSLKLDLKILFGTLATVFRRTGISHAEDATMPEFTGKGARGSGPKQF